MGHSAIAGCGVVGLGSGAALEVVAAVQLKDPTAASSELATEILRLCAAGARRPPDRVVFVDELPTVLGGAKVQRATLREQLLARPTA
jgi:acyl-coenzyme A synthetase/AMP-(fatty) acid ligase